MSIQSLSFINKFTHMLSKASKGNTKITFAGVCLAWPVSQITVKDLNVQLLGLNTLCIVFSLVTVCPCQQFVLEKNCGTSILSLILNPGEPWIEPMTPWFTPELKLNYYCINTRVTQY